MATATRNKTRTQIWSALSLAVGTSQTSSWFDLSQADGASISIQFTNSATPPTAAATVTVTVANNYNAGTPTLPITYTSAAGSINASEIDYFAIEVPPQWETVQITVGGNTGNPITVDADISINTSWTIQ
jgi:hypothetical protein